MLLGELKKIIQFTHFQEKNISKQTADFSQKENILPLRPGKIHVRLVLVSTWRSGSSFASELLVSHPGAYLQV